MTTLQEANALYRSFKAPLIALRGGLRLNRVDTIERDASAHLERLKAENEAVRRLPKAEHARILADVRTEIATSRRQATRHARRQLQGVREAAEQWRQFIDSRRRDVTLSFPDALNGITKDGMVSLALLRVQMTQALSSASPAQLLAIYGAALPRRDDPRALVECEVIESIVASRPLAKTAADRKPAKELRDVIDGSESMRLPKPNDMLDFDDLVEQLQSLDQRMSALDLKVTTDEEAEDTAAFEAEYEAMSKAGERSDLDDQAAYRAELAAAGR